MTEGVVAAGPETASALATLHATAFAAPWSEASFASLLSQPGVTALVGDATPLGGFILVRTIVDEAEILTLAVAPAFRRRGLGRRLLEGALRHAQRQGATRCFLEVAADNAVAIALYRRAGFDSQKTRPGYYRRDGGAIDALIMETNLT